MAFNVDQASLDFALEHLEVQGDSYLLPPAFEIEAMGHVWDEFGRTLAGQDLDMWRTGAKRECLSPKPGLGLRIATQLDPVDTLLTTALVVEVGDRLEAARLPREDGIVHSHRFTSGLPHGRLFHPDFGYASFRERSLEIAEEEDGFVLLTDISDFYPRLYLHRAENALRAALAPDDGMARVLNKFLSQWNQSISYGLPVGPSAIRLVAEITINDVDQALAAEGFVFCRYSDDFRIFVADQGEARRALAFLAHLLSDNHGLSLQAAKTEILSAEAFTERFQLSEQDRATASMQENLGSLLETLGVDTYELPDLDDLPDELVEQIEKANVWELLRKQLDAEHRDSRTTNFVLQQVQWWGLADDEDLLIDHLDRFETHFPAAVRAATANEDLDVDERRELGGKLLGSLDGEVMAHLEFFRAWLLSVFTQTSDWNHTEKLLDIRRRHSDSFTKSYSTLALGVAGVDHWFRSHRGDISLMDPWERRAFLAGASCLPVDERKHWYASVKPNLERLELAVVQWAKDNGLQRSA
jgi:hypothetical protein